ncbi:hypothetical protein SEA_GRASSBOY_72 [Microbacterium phage Grassboy]|nr:hypothetical protein SEA_STRAWBERRYJAMM_73 [Microbacterium phage StrawberryJamm]UVG34329.1 hypothetical protein SEA_GRASSBOY_72 [Microbacterium phage Grassboy]
MTSASHFHPVLGMVEDEPTPETKPAFHPVHGHEEKP